MKIKLPINKRANEQNIKVFLKIPKMTKSLLKCDQYPQLTEKSKLKLLLDTTNTLTTSVGEDVEENELSFTNDGDAN